MTTPLAQLKAQVRAQKTLIPAFYGNVDFDTVPERFAAGRLYRGHGPLATDEHWRL